MKKCAVCEAEIESELEEFGDPREPVCGSCWLSGRLPGWTEEIEEDDERIDDLRSKIQECEDDIRDLETRIFGFQCEISDIEKKKKKVLSK